jgi:hypothetical protein
MGIEGCKQINQLQREALRSKYTLAKEGETEKEEESEKEDKE